MAFIVAGSLVMTQGTDVSVRRKDGTSLRAYLALPAGGAKGPGIVAIHDILGLSPDIRRIADRFADAGYAALAPDLYDRPGVRAICIAQTMLAIRRGKGPAYDDIEAARGHLASLPEVDATRLGITGFCMGGGFALFSAVGGSYRVTAPYYGDVPKEAARLEGICPVVAGFGGRDAIFAPKGKLLQRHLDELGVPNDVKIYSSAGHSYMNQHEPTFLFRWSAIGPLKAGYEAGAAEDSWTRMLAFFEKHL